MASVSMSAVQTSFVCKDGEDRAPADSSTCCTDSEEDMDLVARVLPFAVVSSDVRALVDTALSGWEGEMFQLAAATDNRPLSMLGLFAFERSGLIQHFALDAAKLECFLLEIEKGYRDDVPYHNRIHAASVFHFTHALLQHGEIGKAVGMHFDLHLVALASLVAAAIHDYEHLGLSNKFLEATQHDRAATWDNHHINENHHATAGLEVLRHEDCNFIEPLSDADRAIFLELVRALVLGTDAADDAKLRKSFLACVESCDAGSYFPDSPEEAVLALTMALKCADLGHLATPWDAHCQWVTRLENEFFLQGDQERALGFEDISFLMNRDKVGDAVSENQSGFFEFVALPLFDAVARAFPGAQPMLDGVRANNAKWQRIECRRAYFEKRHSA